MSNRPSRISPSGWDFRSRRFRALWRGHHRIPEATGSRISDSTREMGDVPSRAAQSLVGKRNSGFAGLVLTDPGYGREDSHPGEYLSCLGRGLSEAGHDLFLSAIPDAHSELSVIHKIVSTRRADGLILGWSGEAAPCGPPQDQGFRFANHGRTGAESARMTGWAPTASLPMAQPSRCFARWANAVLRC